MVSPVVGRLKKWIQVRRQRDKRIPGAALAAAAAASTSSTSSVSTSSVHPPPGLTAASSDGTRPFFCSVRVRVRWCVCVCVWSLRG